MLNATLLLFTLALGVAISNYYDSLSVANTALAAQATRAGVLLDQTYLAVLNTLTDIDADGTLEPVDMVAGVNTPTGGGVMPTNSTAIKTDAWGRTYGYCAWDNGTITNGTGFIPGVATPIATSKLFAVISPGPDGTFQTTCDNAAEGNAQGDDIFRVATMANTPTANTVSGACSQVPTEADLPGLANDGDCRLVVAPTPALMYWVNGEWIAMSGSGSGVVATNGPASPILVGLSSPPVLSTGNHTLLVSDGDIAVLGANGGYQLGTGDNALRMVWTMDGRTDVAGVWTTATVGHRYNPGGETSFRLLSDGTLQVVGANRYGISGLGHDVNTIYTAWTNAASGVSAIGGATFAWHASNLDPSVSLISTAYIVQNGAVKCAGYSGAYSGIDSLCPAATATAWSTPPGVGAFTISRVGNVDGAYIGLLIASDGTLLAAEANASMRFLGYHHSFVPVLSGVTDAVGNYDGVIARRADGTVHVRGVNSNGALGTGTTLNNTAAWAQVMPDVKSIAAGTYQAGTGVSTQIITAYSYFLKNDKTLWFAGSGNQGVRGDGSTGSSYTPVQVATDVEAVWTARGSTFIQKSDGHVYATGNNVNGQLGLGYVGGYVSTFTQVL